MEEKIKLPDLSQRLIQWEIKMSHYKLMNLCVVLFSPQKVISQEDEHFTVYKIKMMLNIKWEKGLPKSDFKMASMGNLFVMS